MFNSRFPSSRTASSRPSGGRAVVAHARFAPVAGFSVTASRDNVAMVVFSPVLKTNINGLAELLERISEGTTLVSPAKFSIDAVKWEKYIWKNEDSHFRGSVVKEGEVSSLPVKKEIEFIGTVRKRTG